MTRMVLPISALLLATLAPPAGARHRGGWTPLPCDETCIGGYRCGTHYGETLELPLSHRPVEAVRFYAHDHVGDKHKGKLRVSIDGYELAHRIDVKKSGAVHTVDAHGISGHYLVLAAASDDEVVIEDVEVLYGGHDRPPYRPTPPPPAPYYGGEWRTVPRASGCIGGEICGHHGNEIAVRLSGAPIYGLRLYTHDSVGRKTGGRLRIRLDGWVIEDDLDVKRDGEVYEIELDGQRARYLVLETASDDEVVVERVEVR